MPDAAKTELLRALGQVVRGLSALFWGLGLTALVYAETAATDRLEFLGLLAFVPAVILSAALWRGLNQMRHFQKQERIWQRALNRAEMLAIVNTGLAPFLAWWHKFPQVPFYAVCVGLLFLGSLCLLAQINCVLRRLCAMVPDETLRSETKLFTTFNISMLVTVLAGLAVYCLWSRLPGVPWYFDRWMDDVRAAGIRLGLFLILMPLAMTMALIWKIKEVIFSSLLVADR